MEEPPPHRDPEVEEKLDAELPPAPPRPGEGLEEEGGAHPAGDAVADPDPGEKKADPEQFLKSDPADVSKKPLTTTETTVRKRSHPNPSLKKNPLGSNPKQVSPWKSSPGKDQALSPFKLSPRGLFTTPQSKRRSWRRSSLKGTKRRKSLPPVHQDATELSKSISLDLPETDRLALLLLSSFQFSAQKLEHSLQQNQGFNLEEFQAKVHSVSEELKLHLQKLKRDGTLQRCIQDPQGVSLDSALDESVAQIKEHMTRFSAECRSWDQLLQRYQESAEEMSRQLEGIQRDPSLVQPLSYLQTSQASVLSSKPNYQQILDSQGEVLTSMELVLDELQQAVQVLQSFSEDSHQYLRDLSEQLATRTFRQLENSPVRKLLARPRKPLPPEG